MGHDLGVERRLPREPARLRSRQVVLHRYAEIGMDKDKTLLREFLKLSETHPRYGYWRIWALLRREGYCTNKKRVYGPPSIVRTKRPVEQNCSVLVACRLQRVPISAIVSSDLSLDC